jgi:hypothetical protein
LPAQLLSQGRKAGDFYLEDVSAPAGALNCTAQSLDRLASLATVRGDGATTADLLFQQWTLRN